MHLIAKGDANRPDPNLIFEIEYATSKHVSGFDFYQEEAYEARITDGGMLILFRKDGSLVTAIAPTGYTRVGVMQR